MHKIQFNFGLISKVDNTGYKILRIFRFISRFVQCIGIKKEAMLRYVQIPSRIDIQNAIFRCVQIRSSIGIQKAMFRYVQIPSSIGIQKAMFRYVQNSDTFQYWYSRGYV